MDSSRKIYSHILQQLGAHFPKGEAETMAFWLMDHFMKLSRKDILMNTEVSDLPEALHDALLRLQNNEPIQYVLGQAHFYGHDFYVTKAVLIPRRETEELVYLILKENTADHPRIMDIGTGSGCIPITLSLELPKAEVSAVDISTAALTIAKKNAEKLAARVDFCQVDILTQPIPIRQLDILVSNPPYVRKLEKKAMEAHVLDYEPHLALFVEDEDPLIFYRAIAEKGLVALKVGGRLYFEINEALAEETSQLVTTIGYKKVEIHEDMQGKPRILSAIRQG